MDVERGRTVKGWQPRRLGKNPKRSLINNNKCVIYYWVQESPKHLTLQVF